jgi:hypothetical protein
MAASENNRNNRKSIENEEEINEMASKYQCGSMSGES